MGFTCECYDGPEFFSECERTARKEHKCCECGHAITPGQTYQSCTGKWDGDFRTFRTCERCADLGEAFRDLGYCTSFGELFSSYAEWRREADPRGTEGDDPRSGRSKAVALQEKHRNWSPRRRNRNE